MEVILNFYGVGVKVVSEEDELTRRIHKDFSFFVVEHLDDTQKNIDVVSKLEMVSEIPYPLLIPRFKNRNLILYQKKHIRICDYHGDGLCIFNLKEDKATFYNDKLNRLHELTYLFILSRVGKALDLMGLHRLHGMAVIKDKTLFVGMMPMNGGKTTLLSFLLNDGRFANVSDDSPLIDKKGRVLPFPIRIGFEENGQMPELFEKTTSYQLERKEYGKKTLFSLEDLNVSISGDYQNIILFRGFKGASFARLKKVSSLKFIGFIFEQGVIGIGLPILIEYFWEFGFVDFLKKAKIFISRVQSFRKFLSKSETYYFEMSSDIKENVDCLIEKKSTH